MHFAATSLITLLTASYASAQLHLGKIGVTHDEEIQWAKDYVAALSSEIAKPSYTAFAKEVEPYLNNPAQVSQEFREALPTNIKELKEWVTHPLAFATDSPQPEFVQNMPENVRKDWLNWEQDNVKLAASLANKDFFGNNSPRIVPGFGWALGFVAGGVGLLAIML